MKKLSGSGFREIDHTADWAIEVWAPDLEGLFVQAVAGMHTLMGIEVLPGPMVTHPISLSAADKESLLVAFLDELLYLIESRAVACDSMDLNFSETDLHARITAKPIASVQRQIKAVTYHNLEIKMKSDTLTVTVVFDV